MGSSMITGREILNGESGATAERGKGDGGGYERRINSSRPRWRHSRFELTLTPCSGM